MTNGVRNKLTPFYLKFFAARTITECEYQAIKLADHTHFAYEDVDEVNLLRGQAKNDKTDLQFDDFSVKEAYDSENADYIKRQIRDRIDRCSVTVVYLTDNTASSSWANWEIEESLKRGKGVIGVYKGDSQPAHTPPAFQQNNCKAVKWDHAALMKAIEDASAKR